MTIAPSACPQCGQTNDADAKFCKACGSRFAAGLTVQAGGNLTARDVTGRDRIDNPGPGAVGTSGAVVAGAGGAAVGVNAGNIYVGGDDPAERERAAQRCYLQRLRRACSVLPLAALGGDENADDEITLERVYIDLDTQTPVPLTEAEQKERPDRPNFAAMRGGDTRPLTALECALSAPGAQRLALLGEPGSGKSTFARRLLGWLAGAQLGESDWPPGLSTELLPIFIILRDLAPRLAALSLDHLPAGQQAEALAGAVREQMLADLASLEAADFAAGLQRALQSGACLLVLDGLDEVPQALRLRVRQAAASLLARYPIQRLLLTCRVRSYVGETVFPNFQAHTLAPYDEDKIRNFAAAWYNAQKNLGRFDAKQAEAKAADLAAAALGDDLRELSSNPMMLTTMAIIHQREIGLPRERVRLYNLAVDVLLRRWQKGKTGALADFLSDDLRLRAVLERLAYEAHRAGQGERVAADLPRGLALTLLEAREYLGSPGLASEFLDYVDQRAGLLVGRGGELGRPTTYGFPHRTFQEYLAGCHLAGQRDAARVYFVHAAEGDLWNLAAQLGAEDLHYNRRNANAVLDLAYRLCPAREPANEQSWRALVWSGNLAVLVGREAVERDAASPDGGPAYLQRLIPRLVAALRGALSAPERAEAGRALAGLGDPRDLDEWIAVPAGTFWMGSDRKLDAEAYTNEEPQHEVWVGAFRLGKYPVTVGQWRVFVEATGYSAHERSLAGLANHPAVCVSWGEARAYCAWLTGVWRAAGKIGPRDVARLPTEAEWEKAARGPDKRLRAWGDDPNPNKANTYETGLGQTSAVGLFPAGKSPYGCLDMLGNVLEWTQSKFQAYPYQAQDGREELDGDSARVLRGGAFYNNRGIARCAVRVDFRPGNRSDFIGFRVCVVSPVLESLPPENSVP